VLWWADRTSQWQRYTGFWSVVRTIRSSLQSLETSYCQLVRMNNNYPGSEIKILLFNHSTNTISLTDAKTSNGMENKGWLRSPGLFVRVCLLFVLADYSDEYKTMSTVNWIIASFRWTNMWWMAGVPAKWWTKWISAVRYILFWKSAQAAVSTHFHPILSVQNGDTKISERDLCFPLCLNFPVWLQSFSACQFQAHQILGSRNNSGYSLNQQCWII